MQQGGYRVGMAQILIEGGRPEANLNRAENVVRQAAARECRLVVLPECLDLGWTDPSARDLAQPLPGPHTDHPGHRLLQSRPRPGNATLAGRREQGLVVVAEQDQLAPPLHEVQALAAVGAAGVFRGL